jgi:hypothetical protein
VQTNSKPVSSVLTRSWAVLLPLLYELSEVKAFAVRALFALRQIVAESA